MLRLPCCAATAQAVGKSGELPSPSGGAEDKQLQSAALPFTTVRAMGVATACALTLQVR